MTNFNMNKVISIFLILFSCVSFSAAAELDLQKLSGEDIQKVNAILEKLSPLIKKEEPLGNLPLLKYEQLYMPLSEDEQDLLFSIQELNPKKLGIKTPFLGLVEPKPDWVKIEGQQIKDKAGNKALPPQYLSRDVYRAYKKMMLAMKKDLGKQLYVDSGYRSPAYQLYLFIFYLAKRQYSLTDTAAWNALPGYSEHGFPPRQAIDFVSQDGVNGDMDPEAFEKLEEYQWLLKRAHKFGFELSYTRNNPSGISFEPWHWHYVRPKRQKENG